MVCAKALLQGAEAWRRAAWLLPCLHSGGLDAVATISVCCLRSLAVIELGGKQTEPLRYTCVCSHSSSERQLFGKKKEREKKLKHAICKYETSERSIRAVMGSPLTWTLLVVFVWFVVLWSGCNSRASIYSGFPAGQCIKGKTLNAAGYEAIGDSEELFYVALSGKCWRTSWSKHTTPCWHIQKRAYPKLRADRATQKVIDSKSSAVMSIFLSYINRLCVFCFVFWLQC